MTSRVVTAPFKPYEWQKAPFDDTSPVMLLTGSSNGGKSHIAAEKVHAYLLHYPGATALLLRKAREYATKSIVPMMKRVIGADPSVRYINGRFVYANGSMAYIGGMKNDEQREAIRSLGGKEGEPDIAWMEEANAFTRTDFDEVVARTRGHVGGWTQVILSTNPDIPQHWIYTDLILKKGAAAIYYSSIADNERATQKDFDRLDRLTGVLRERLKEGRWVRAEGVVYETFNPEIHLIDESDMPKGWKDWRRVRVIDFGFTNPFVCEWWAIDNDGRAYLYKEFVKTKAIVQDNAQVIKKNSQGRIEATVADHDAEDRATLDREGIGTVPAIKEVRRGIQLVQNRLQVQKDGKPRLFIIRGALIERDEEYDGPQGLEEEISAYAWQKFQDGKPNKEEPAKIYDHSCDCARYLASYLDSAVPLPGKQPEQKSKWLDKNESIMVVDDDEGQSHDDDELHERSRWKRY